MTTGDDSPDAKIESKNLDGLSGWLILVGLGVVLAPLRMLFMLVPVYLEMFRNGGWEAISTPASEHYNPALMAFLGGEMLFNTLVLIASCYLIFLFFIKHPHFPKWYIGVLLVSLVMLPLDAWLGSKILPGEPVWDTATLKEFIRSVVVSVIWIPYMLMSRRVKMTFRDRNRKPDLDLTA